MQHRWEDLALILEVLRGARPPVAVELGTATGGFAVFLAMTLGEWDGWVLTVDRQQSQRLELEAACSNLICLEADLFVPPPPRWVTVPLRNPGALLYCDNGNKLRELALYAPYLGERGLVGVHDYGTEVPPEQAEALMRVRGFAPWRHEAFEALAHPEHYPVSLTRFWRRTLLETSIE